jgi:hypothetical protein
VIIIKLNTEGGQMKIEIVWIPYNLDGEVSRLGTAYNKQEIINIIRDNKVCLKDKGVLEYIVEDNKIIRYASGTDDLAIKKVLEKIFKP